MKVFLALLLAVLVLAGSFTACCASGDCADEVVHAGGPVKEKGDCSPFFACAFCSGFVQAPHTAMPRPPMPLAGSFPAPFAESMLSDYHASFFQPPRFRC